MPISSSSNISSRESSSSNEHLHIEKTVSAIEDRGEMLGLNQYDSDSSSSSSSEEEEETKVRQKEDDVKRVEKKVEKKIEKVVKELPSASGLFGRRNVPTSVGKKRKAEDKNGLFVPPQTRMKRANKSTEDVT